MIVTKCKKCNRINLEFGIFNADEEGGYWISERRLYCKHGDFKTIRMIQD